MRPAWPQPEKFGQGTPSFFCKHLTGLTRLRTHLGKSVLEALTCLHHQRESTIWSLVFIVLQFRKHLWASTPPCEPSIRPLNGEHHMAIVAIVQTTGGREGAGLEGVGTRI